MDRELRFLFGSFVLCILVSFCIATSNLGVITNSDGNTISDRNVFDANGSIDGNVPRLIGGDRDEHGCLVAAGYSWCEQKQTCLRIWEEPCTDNNAPHRVNQPIDRNDLNAIPIPTNPVNYPVNGGPINPPIPPDQRPVISTSTVTAIQDRIKAQEAFETRASIASVNETRTTISMRPVIFSTQSAEAVESNPRVISLIAQVTTEQKRQIIAPQALSSTTSSSSPRPVTVTKHMSINNVRRNDTNVEKVMSGFVLSLTNNTTERLYDVTLVEVVPKEVALKASEITSVYTFNILESDPVIEFIIPLVEPGESVSLDYGVDGNLDGTDLNASGPPVVLFLKETNLASSTDTNSIGDSDSNLPLDENNAIAPQATQPALPLEIIGIAAVVIVIILLILIIFLRKEKPGSDAQVNTKPEPNEPTTTESNAQIDVTVPEQQTAPPTL